MKAKPTKFLYGLRKHEGVRNTGMGEIRAVSYPEHARLGAQNLNICSVNYFLRGKYAQKVRKWIAERFGSDRIIQENISYSKSLSLKGSLILAVYPLFKEHPLEIQQFCGGPMSA